jgi:hypothetical protein
LDVVCIVAVAKESGYYRCVLLLLEEAMRENGRRRVEEYFDFTPFFQTYNIGIQIMHRWFAAQLVDD